MSHRLLMGGSGRLDQPIGEGILVPAKALGGHSDIRWTRGRLRMTWHHFAQARHELIRVNGVRPESLLLGPMMLNALSRRARLHLQHIFGATTYDKLSGPPARPLETVDATKQMLAVAAQARRFSRLS